jgi:hypothetical protein
VSGNSPVDYRWIPHDFGNIGGGLNVDAQDAKANESRELSNADLNIRGSIRKRGGYADCNASPITLVGGSNGIASIFQFLKMVSTAFVKFLFVSYDDTLAVCTVDPSDCLSITGLTSLRSGLTNVNFSTASMCNRALFISPDHALWSDGAVVRQLGIDAPAVAPMAYVTAGAVNRLYQS